ncbi:hypothetical protein BC628DRAFT_1418360 [Trametes gibbosa]|nr:hypothetical protein BC628DRAFT_1418360 [Trametes gibbosa]
MSSDSGLGWNVWGVISGSFGIMATLASCFVVWLRTRYPSKKLPALITLWEETDGLLKSAIALNGGSITADNDLEKLRLSVLTAQVLLDDLCAVVYRRRFMRDSYNWWNGVTGEITKFYEELNDIRVNLIIRNSARRKLLIPIDFKPEFSLCSTRDKESSTPPNTLQALGSSTPPLPPPLNASERKESTSFSAPREPTSFVPAAMPKDVLLPIATSPDSTFPTHSALSDQDLKRLSSLLHGQSLGLRPKHGRLRATTKTISRIVRGVYGVDRGLDKASSDLDPDPESLARHDEHDEYYAHEFAEV